MRLKQRPNDFKVDELLHESFIQSKGDHRLFRVSKRKLTSLEAAEELADMCGVPTGEVAMAGLKDRQGQTVQYMSVHRGKSVRTVSQDLTVEPIGFCSDPINSGASRGNAFSIVVRDLVAPELRHLRASMPAVRDFGLPNYFDEQRFGNLKHNQGWLAKDLLLGKKEVALKRLLTTISDWDNPRIKRFKSALYQNWGDWGTCRDIAGRFGQHHSVFEHLRANDGDFGGAWRYIASRVRLIHLYAYQSHLWNRAVVKLFEHFKQSDDEVFGTTMREGLLLFPKVEMPIPPEWQGNFPLPGPGLDNIVDPLQRDIFERVLAFDGIEPQDFRIEGVPGFAIKGEPRALMIHPVGLHVRPADPDPLNEGRKLVRISFELPRGAYATMVMKRLFGSPRLLEDERSQSSGYGDRGDWGDRGQRGAERDGRGGDRSWGGRDSRGRGGRDEQRSGSWSGGGKDARGGDREGQRSGYQGRGGGSQGGGYRGSGSQGGGHQGGGYRGSSSQGGGSQGGGYQGRGNQGSGSQGSRGYQGGGGGYQGGDRGGQRGGSYGSDRDRGERPRQDRGDRGGSWSGGGRDTRSGGYEGQRGGHQGGASRSGGYQDRGGSQDRGGYQGGQGGGYRGNDRGREERPRQDRGGRWSEGQRETRGSGSQGGGSQGGGSQGSGDQGGGYQGRGGQGGYDQGRDGRSQQDRGGRWSGGNRDSRGGENQRGGNQGGGGGYQGRGGGGHQGGYGGQGGQGSRGGQGYRGGEGSGYQGRGRDERPRQDRGSRWSEGGRDSGGDDRQRGGYQGGGGGYRGGQGGGYQGQDRGNRQDRGGRWSEGQGGSRGGDQGGGGGGYRGRSGGDDRGRQDGGRWSAGSSDREQSSNPGRPARWADDSGGGAQRSQADSPGDKGRVSEDTSRKDVGASGDAGAPGDGAE